MSARDRHEKAKRWGKKTDRPLYEREDSSRSFESVRTRATEEQQQHRSHLASTIRSVTPDSVRDGHRGPTPTERKKSLFAAGPFHASPPSSPPQAVRHRHSQRDILRPPVPRTVSENVPLPEGDSVASPTVAPGQSARPRTRTLEERRREGSPSSFLRKARSRVGSVASNASTSAYRGSEETVTSIGHPSTIPQAPVTTAATASVRSGRSERNRLAKTQRQPPTTQRSASPVSSSASLVDLPPRAIPTANARRIFNLMRSTCGCMEGLLAFRRGETSPWGLAYCIINDESGSLVYEPKGDASSHRTLISDLRGCEVRTALDPDSHHPYLDVIPSSSNLEVHLRPQTGEEFENWFAALLCWQPIKPKGIMNLMAKAQPGLTSDRRQGDRRRHSEVSLREVPVIKVGKMIHWDTMATGEMASHRTSSRSGPRRSARRWRRVSCTLRENGELKMYSETDVSPVSTVQLSELERCAIQRLDSSVLDADYSIAIYPQFTSGSFGSSSARPIFLSMETRLIFESWLVLLRAFTIPQLYGPEPAFDPDAGFPSPPSSNMFRMERNIVVRIMQAKILPPVSPTMSGEMTLPRQHSDRPAAGGLYAEVLLDEESRAKTLIRSESAQPFWREEFDFADLPAALSVVSIRLKERPDAAVPKERSIKDEAKRMYDTTGPSMGSGSALTGSSGDHTVGQVDIYLDDLGTSKEVEKWWPLTNRYGQSVGEIQIGIRAEEAVILLAKDYQEMSGLLHRFNNGLTPQIAQVLSGQLIKLSEHLLNIFQVSGRATEWLSALIEEEIDSAGGVETPRMVAVNRLRLSKRIGNSPAANASREGLEESPLDNVRTIDREIFVRDMGKSATVEANLLFRANTLCTKSLDLHMRRLGREYLDVTLGDKMREIADRDPDCEVDPNRVDDRHELQRNWRRLMDWTNDVWKCIYNSWQQCPPELRLIFRHVMACAEDRFGDYLRTVRYSSVSGFLFLRFFCPAILGPKLFGLLKDDPKPKARRAITLIAKIIMSLANVATFGVKEPFMEPANQFLTSHRQQFKEFIDNICSIPTSTSPLQAHIHPNYSTPIAIIGRMPPPAREGFPSLPYLIDHARSFSDLMELWLENTKSVSGSLESDGSGDLGKFHRICVALKDRSVDVLAKAERAEKPNLGHEPKWERLVDELARDVGVSLADSPMPLRAMNHVYPGLPPGSSDGPMSRPAGPRTNTAASASSAVSQYSNSVSTFDDQYGATERAAGSMDIQGSAGSMQDADDEAVHWKNASYMKSEEAMATALPSIDGHTPGSKLTIRGRDKYKESKEKDDEKRSFLSKFGKKHKG